MASAKTVTKSNHFMFKLQVVTKFNVTKSRLHCTTILSSKSEKLLKFSLRDFSLQISCFVSFLMNSVGTCLITGCLFLEEIAKLKKLEIEFYLTLVPARFSVEKSNGDTF